MYYIISLIYGESVKQVNSVIYHTTNNNAIGKIVSRHEKKRMTIKIFFLANVDKNRVL